ncbi:MAG TPA: hypothetical protein VFQ84_09200 [Arenimonas sp.]|uniref:hypothetical protein n=1 Tax=Arenimonas sp. TaxID=1872635 RepID=UPI002D7FA316|nr:hypothetical protein [Arenimonas sp.]HEU0153507.1 hypothetical protein [Arenimonas sp.]
MTLAFGGWTVKDVKEDFIWRDSGLDHGNQLMNNVNKIQNSLTPHRAMVLNVA